MLEYFPKNVDEKILATFPKNIDEKLLQTVQKNIYKNNKDKASAS
jgi:hypothetical protein